MLGRALAIDYGKKRSGLAVTDNDQIIANGLTTVDTSDLMSYLQNYCKEEEVEVLVVGEPKRLDLSETHATQLVEAFVKKLKGVFPETRIAMVDERFTSKMAFDAIVQSGVPKQKRKDKSLIDEVSAAIILQSYLETKHRE